MDAPEVRLSPDGEKLAIRWPHNKWWMTLGRSSFESFVDPSEVSDWTPLRPASSEDGRPYTVRLTSDDVVSEQDFHLTDAGRGLLLEIAAVFNANAKFSVDHRVFVEPAQDSS